MINKPSMTLIWPNSAVLFQSINYAQHPDILKKIIQKSRFKADQSDIETLLFALFSEVNNQTDLPMAQLRVPNQIAICADPCYLHPDRDRLLVFAKDLTLTTVEATALIETIQPLLDNFGGQLQQTTPMQWTLTLQNAPDLQFSALAALEGHSVRDNLPTGADQRDWLRLWNEIQMTLFEHPINLQREAKGQLPINAVWFWGAGTLKLHSNLQSVSGQHATLQALVAVAGLPHQFECPARATGQHLHLLPAFDPTQDWADQLVTLATELTTFWQPLRRLQLSSVRLMIPQHGSYALSAWKSWL